MYICVCEDGGLPPVVYYTGGRASVIYRVAMDFSRDEGAERIDFSRAAMNR